MPESLTQYLKIMNQVFELEKKIQSKPDLASLQRNIDRITAAFGELGLSSNNPLGEEYTETRTDCVASISGEGKGKLKIVNVIKPVIYIQEENRKIIVQKAVVIAE